MDTIHIKTVKTRTAPFWRVGRKFTSEPSAVEVESLADGELARLIRDPLLIGLDEDGGVLFEGGAAKGAALDDFLGQTPEEEETEAAELEERVAKAMLELGADGFTKGGKPDLDALKTALPDDAAAINGKLRDKVWAYLEADGAKPPEAAT